MQQLKQNGTYRSVHLKFEVEASTKLKDNEVPYTPLGGGGGGALGCLGGRIRSLSKFKNTPKALIFGQKSTLILIKTLTFSTK